MLVPTELGRIVRIAVVTALLAVLALPALEARAAADLYPGAPAVVSSLSAPFASMKAAPDPSAVEVIQVDNGISANIVAGPAPGVDGLLWYQVEIAGLSGFIAEADLAWGTPAEVGAAPEQQAEPVPPVVTGNGVVISADGSDIHCRIAPNTESEWNFTYISGSSVDLAGIAADGWQPVICAAQLGYLPAELVYDPANLPAPTPTETVVVPVETEIVETPEATEIIPEVTETIVIPEETVIVELPEATETVTIPEETATVEVPDATETVPATDPTGTPQAETPIATQTAVATETVIVEVTETPVIDEATPDVTTTATAETVGQTITVEDDLVVSASIAGSATVYNTGSGGLRCRSGASLESQVLMVLPLGTSVSLTGPVSNGWQPVVCGEQAGFVAARFLQAGAETDSGEEPVEAAAALTGSSGVIQNTDGDGLRCRSSASYSGSVITVIPEGTTVYSRGSAVGVWQPITCAGQAGWVHIDYLGNGSGGGSTGSTGGAATVYGTNGDGVRFRTSAGYDGAVISVLMEGTTVTLRNGSIGSWTAVTYGGRNGFVFADYLTTARNPSPGGGSGVGGSNLSAGSNALVNDSLNFRDAPSYSGEVMGVASYGTVVRITGSPTSGFYPVRWGGVDGYMYGDYLEYTTQGLSTSGPGGGGAGSGGGSASGQSMVDFAMRYLGYPYVWATHGPNSFDCSGFTYWVVLNVLGEDIGAGTWTQWGTGTPIQYGNLQPGDLVFFQNTYTVGLSHVGMYIGGDQFIHAENENTGVRISSLSSNYYSTRYLGARRMT